MASANLDLMARYRRALGKARRRDHDELLEAKDAYEVAIVLSNGPDPNRSEHWERRAIEAEKALANLVERFV